MLDARSTDEANAAAELLAPHAEALRRLALRLTASHCDAEDLLQAVLLKLHVHRFRVRHVHDLRPWLYRVMYYQFIDQTRQMRKHAGISLDAVHSEAIESGLRTWACSEDGQSAGDLTGPELCAFRMQLKDFVDAALDGLGPVQRQAIALHDLDGLSLPEIAARCELPLNTLKSALTQARARLRAQLSAFDVLNAQLAGRRRTFTTGKPQSRSSYRRARRRRPHGGNAQDLS